MLHVAGAELASEKPRLSVPPVYAGAIVSWHVCSRCQSGAFVTAAGVMLISPLPFAFMTKKRMTEKLVALSIAIAFMVFLVRVGVDEMQWFRLYLPALPFLLLLAGLGLRNILDALGALFKREGWLPAAAGWALVLYAGWNSFQFTYKELGGFNGHADLAGTYHPDLGKFITRHERPGGLVAFQDMGSTPYDHGRDLPMFSAPGPGGSSYRTFCGT